MHDDIGAGNCVNQRCRIAEVSLDRTNVCRARDVASERGPVIHQHQLMTGRHEMPRKQSAEVTGRAGNQNPHFFTKISMIVTVVLPVLRKPCCVPPLTNWACHAAMSTGFSDAVSNRMPADVGMNRWYCMSS